MLLNGCGDVLGLDIRAFIIVVFVLRLLLLLCVVRKLIDLFWCHCLNGRVGRPEQICADIFTLHCSNPIDQRLKLRPRLLTFGGRVY